jgi:hypothetical protein
MSAQDESKGALRAIRRAAVSARKRAARYEVPLAIWKDGEIAFLPPDNKGGIAAEATTTPRVETSRSRVPGN